MAIVNIPIDGVQPFHRFSIELDGRVYILKFRFNFRDSRWHMSILQEDETVLIAGIPLVVSWGLIRRFADERLPPGEFFVEDVTGENTEPGENSFGRTHFLRYREVDTK